MKYNCKLSEKANKESTCNFFSKAKRVCSHILIELKSIIKKQTNEAISSDIVSHINTLKNKSIYQFIFEQNKFYNTHFNQLSSCVIREKRLLNFETPNRVKITHEYDIDKFIPIDKEVLFLFLPKSRLNWLKIFIDGKRVVIAKSSDIKEAIYHELKDEVDELKSKFEIENLWDEIWNEVEPIPCFIFNQWKGKTEPIRMLIEFEYFESIEINSKHLLGFMNLIDERSITYNYLPATVNNAWLYVHAPNKFTITVNPIDDSLSNIERNGNGFGIDPEIVSYTIKKKSATSSSEQSYPFQINIKVPSSLKWWYNTLYAASGLYSIFLIIRVAIKITDCSSIEILSKNISTIPTIGASIIALIIATRGWLMNEETILCRFSKYLTSIVILLFILLLLHSFLF